MSLARALDAFYAGDAAALDALLRADPSLVHARVDSDQGHYCGYFYRATLLHHVAGNPDIRPLPPNTVALAELLLDRGAEIDAITAPGPSQPTDIGWSALGLAATSSTARELGFQTPLLELLHARGADLDVRNGGAIVGALYYGEVDAARWLADHGARVDFVVAAGLGRIDLMEAHPDHTLVHYASVAPRPTTRDQLLSLALVYACTGRSLAAATWLLDRGAPLGIVGADTSPLHQAAYLGDRALCDLLLSRGADRTLLDPTHHATPAGWAAHAGHTALAADLV